MLFLWYAGWRAVLSFWLLNCEIGPRFRSVFFAMVGELCPMGSRIECPFFALLHYTDLLP
jgi:hypothetical protein